ncbi:hypothetical protein ACOSQ2_006794 [Xanthoceras sorbifolium]
MITLRVFNEGNRQVECSWSTFASLAKAFGRLLKIRNRLVLCKRKKGVHFFINRGPFSLSVFAGFPFFEEGIGRSSASRLPNKCNWGHRNYQAFPDSSVSLY